MATKFTLEYWIDDGCYVGRLREVPGVFSQGETLAELTMTYAATVPLGPLSPEWGRGPG